MNIETTNFENFTSDEYRDNLLPPIGQMVVANVKFTRNWSKCLGGLKITQKEMLVMRIKSSSNSNGWQWSGVDSDSLINGDVVSWHYR